MKTNVFRFMCLLALITPMTAASQTNIKSAFDAIIKCPQAEIMDAHSMSKDRQTNLRSGQDDIYWFSLPANKMDLVKNVMNAFDKDMASAFVVKKGKNIGDKNTMELYSGEFSTEGKGYMSVDDPGSDYIYELFAPSESEDPDGIYRYAYAFNYREKDGKIVGKMIINYATTSEYRQQARETAQRARDLEWTISMSKASRESATTDTQQTWFELVMACVNGMEEANPKTRIALATKAYRLISDVKSYPEVTSQDKKTISQIFKLIKSKYSSDPILLALLQQCDAGLN